MDFLHFLFSQDNILIVAGVLLSGTLLVISALRQHGKSSAIGTTQAIQWINQRHAIWVDVRPTDKYQGGHIPQARNVPIADIENKSAGLPKNKPLVVVCEEGGRDALSAVSKLKAQGFTQVVALKGGLRAWGQEGFPITQKG